MHLFQIQPGQQFNSFIIHAGVIEPQDAHRFHLRDMLHAFVIDAFPPNFQECQFGTLGQRLDTGNGNSIAIAQVNCLERFQVGVLELGNGRPSRGRVGVALNALIRNVRLPKQALVDGQFDRLAVWGSPLGSL